MFWYIRQIIFLSWKTLSKQIVWSDVGNEQSERKKSQKVGGSIKEKMFVFANTQNRIY